VYNGRRYVSRTLESLLAQTFRDFELVITDNGSTDGTEQICRDFAARDPRIRYHRADRNQGVVRNFNWCFELSRGEYFHWNAADDMVAPTFLEKCVALLDAEPAVINAFARSTIIDEQDKPVRVNDYDASAEDPRPHVRFDRVINIDHKRHCAQEIYGLIRRSALARTPLYEPFVRTDSILIARLALIGQFRAIEEPLFLNREHEQRSVKLVPGQKANTRSRLSRYVGVGPIPPPEFWNPALAQRLTFPEFRILGEYWRSLKFASLGAGDRIKCWGVLLKFTVKHLPKLVRDLLIATEHALLGRPGATRTAPTPVEPITR
jgi:glycosyltransferase involved in cell wall biosynthesis